MGLFDCGQGQVTDSCHMLMTCCASTSFYKRTAACSYIIVGESFVSDLHI
jgi:hypothetical protein